jgi:hypothetical protein
MSCPLELTSRVLRVNRPSVNAAPVDVAALLGR